MANSFLRNREFGKTQFPKRALNKCHDRFILNYSSLEFANMTQWVSCAFSCNNSQEHLMVLGDEEGYVTLADARNSFNPEQFTAKSWTFQADTSVIMGCYFVPNQENRLITISGSSAVCVWDLETQKPINCLGHEMSVRALSVSSENPFCVITGARDGMVLVWDTRESMKLLSKGVSSIKCLPYRKYAGAHLNTIPVTPKEQHRPKRSRLSISAKSSPINFNLSAKKMATITAVLAADEKYFLSASSSSQSGIRLWDMRYQQCSKPVRIFDVPKRLSKDCGMTSMCWDRFSSKFYATCTDNCVYEYALWNKSNMPIATYVGATINSFYVQCAASPISDHLISGSSNDYALIWDLQQNQRYIQDDFFNENFLCSNTNYLPNPKFKLKGHKSEVFNVCWSQNAKYLVTMDESWLRIWDSTLPFNQSDEEITTSEQIINSVPRKVNHPFKLSPAANVSQILPTRKAASTHVLINLENKNNEMCDKSLFKTDSRKRFMVNN